MMKRFMFLIVILIVVSTLPAQPVTRVTSILCSDLGTHVPLVGSLGKPLGQVVSIEGATVEPDFLRSKSQEGATLMRVLRVDGIELPEPVIVELGYFTFLDLKAPKPSTKCQVRGYEDGGMRGIPSGAIEVLRKKHSEPAAEGWHFHTAFMVLEDLDAGG